MKNKNFWKNNKIFRLILCIEILILAMSISLGFKENKSVKLSSNRFSMNENQNIVSEDGYIGTLTGEDTEQELLNVTTAIGSGAYDVFVTYEADSTPDEDNYSTKDTSGYVHISAASNGIAIKQNDIQLKDVYHTAHSRIWVRTGAGIDDLKISVMHNGFGKLMVKQIQFKEYLPYRFAKCLGWFLLFAGIDLFYYMFFADNMKNHFTKKTGIIGGILLITIFSSLLFFTNRLYFADDLYFHLNRISALAEAIQEGQIPHRIQHSMVDGYGYATPLFYGEIFLIFPALLYLIGLPLQLSYQFFAVAVNFFTAVISYYSFAKITKDWKKGLFASLLYTCAIYRLLDVWYRASVGEYCAMIFLPLLFYGFYNLYMMEKRHYYLSDYLPIVLALTGIIQSHILSCEMAAIFIFLFAIIFIKKTLCMARFITLVKSVILTVLLNLWFLFPFLQSMKMDVEVNTKQLFKIESMGYSWQQFLGLISTIPSDNNVNFVQGALGISILFVIVVFLFCCIKRNEWELKNEKIFKVAKSCFAFGIIALFMASKMCPWDNLYHVNEFLFKWTAMVQFPWRYMAFACLFLVSAGTLSMVLLEKKTSKKCVVKVMAVIASSCVCMSGYFMVTGISASPEQYLYCADAIDSGYVMGGEYLFHHSWDIFRSKASDAEEGLNVGDVELKNGVYSVVCKNTTMSEKTVSIPVLAYDNYHIYLENNEEIGYEKDYYGRISMKIPGAYNGKIIVKYEEPGSWRVAECISLLTMLCLISIYVYENKTIKSNKRK